MLPIRKNGRTREVVQPGRIPGLGPGGRRFESCPPDEREKPKISEASKLRVRNSVSTRKLIKGNGENEFLMKQTRILSSRRKDIQTVSIPVKSA